MWDCESWHLWLVFFILRAQVLLAAGTFELQIKQLQHSNGLLWYKDCCDARVAPGNHCNKGHPCDTFFRLCLKEYQKRVSQSGPCIFGAGATPVISGSHFSSSHQHNDERSARIEIPFQYAWPRSYSLVLEILGYGNRTAGQGEEQMIEQVLHSAMLNPGDQWQPLRHHGRVASVDYKVRFRCSENYFGPACNKFCRARDDFFGHHNCDPGGNKVCMEGWTGPECRQAICKPTCHLVHGYCELPGECRCHYGWQGPFCDRCVPYPGCVHGSCSEPWKCMCDTNWGGLLCDKDLNYCGNHQPCLNGGTCANAEPNEYQCICKEGFRGKDCEIAEHACLSNPCANGGSCLEVSTGFQCECTEDWTGPTCMEDKSRCRMCSPGEICEETINGYRCRCLPEFTGKSCHVKFGACVSAPCLNGGHCVDLDVGYLCRCPEGFSGSYCEVVVDLCSSSCQQDAPCEIPDGGYGCTCPEGSNEKNCKNDSCHMSSCSGFGSPFYLTILLLPVLAVFCCVLSIFLLARHRRQAKGSRQVPVVKTFNNQRESINLIRNLPGAESRAPCKPEEIELTLPSSTATVTPIVFAEKNLSSQEGDADGRKPLILGKLDISNHEREKLNLFKFSDQQELEV
ncbi:protein jagged-1b [Polypterus senegalus]|uniref:protein jagged-1b n=1 Tax=Polypterus senegalus TaxID=55291 RepID=UPI0019664375|nr:protein jagged-1b [Polypterus senegalus]